MDKKLRKKLCDFLQCDCGETHCASIDYLEQAFRDAGWTESQQPVEGEPTPICDICPHSDNCPDHDLLCSRKELAPHPIWIFREDEICPKCGVRETELWRQATEAQLAHCKKTMVRLPSEERASEIAIALFVLPVGMPMGKELLRLLKG